MATTSSDDGLGFFSLLFLVFLVLKLTGVIAWSWWWICAPIWGPFLLVGIIGTVWLAVKVFTGK